MSTSSPELTRMSDPISRRRLLLAMLSIAGVELASTAWGRVINELCRLTPFQTEGPYYPPRLQLEAMLDKDSDLTQVSGRSGRAKGQVIYVMGQARDEQCRPLEGAMVEIWQASENGRYHHPRDEGNPAPLDPHFQYWGKQVTKPDGRYLFKTIKPGSYQAGPGWIRPPHIHFKISHKHAPELTTQMYFAGDPHQASDYILNRVPTAERERVIVTPEPQGPGSESDVLICRFDLTLRAS